MENIKSSKSFDMLKKLMTLGMTTERVEVEGFTFEIGTLSEKESSELLSSLIVLEERDRIIASKSHSVAMSIKKINDMDFDFIVENSEIIPEDIVTNASKKIFFVKSLQMSVVNKLFEKYTEMNKILEEEDKKK